MSVPPLQNSILQTKLSVRRGIFYTSFTPGFASLHPELIIFCPVGAEALFRLHGFLTGFTSQFGVHHSIFEIQSFSLLVRSSAPTTTTRSSAARRNQAAQLTFSNKPNVVSSAYFSNLLHIRWSGWQRCQFFKHLL